MHGSTNHSNLNLTQEAILGILLATPGAGLHHIVSFVKTSSILTKCDEAILIMFNSFGCHAHSDGTYYTIGLHK